MNFINCSSCRSWINSKFLVRVAEFALPIQYASCQTAILHQTSWVNLSVVMWVGGKCKLHLKFRSYLRYLLWKNMCPMLSTWKKNQIWKCILTFETSCISSVCVIWGRITIFKLGKRRMNAKKLGDHWIRHSFFSKQLEQFKKETSPKLRVWLKSYLSVIGSFPKTFAFLPYSIKQ